MTAGRLTTTVVVVVVAVLVTLAGCGSSKRTASVSDLPLATIGVRYQAAMQPSTAALSAIVSQALGYHGGSPAGLDSAVPATVTTLTTSSRLLDALRAGGPLGQAIVNVVRALNALVGDLGALRAAGIGAVQAAIARVVADAGRESAANNVVGLVLTLLTTPTSDVPVSVVPPPELATTTTTGATTTTTRATTTTTRATATTTTTRPRATTTIPATTITIPPTTTVAPTTTLPHTTPTKPKPILRL